MGFHLEKNIEWQTFYAFIFPIQQRGIVTNSKLWEFKNCQKRDPFAKLMYLKSFLGIDLADFPLKLFSNDTAN